MEKIYWRDISGLSDRWMTKDELVEEADKAFNNECITVGWVIRETEDYLLIVATRNDKDEEYHDASMIMKGVIIRREEI